MSTIFAVEFIQNVSNFIHERPNGQPGQGNKPGDLGHVIRKGVNRHGFLHTVDGQHAQRL